MVIVKQALDLFELFLVFLSSFVRIHSSGNLEEDIEPCEAQGLFQRKKTKPLQTDLAFSVDLLVSLPQ